MYTHSDMKNKKSIHFMDPMTKVSRRECLAIAQIINKPYVIKVYFTDWVNELGDYEDRSNLAAPATWVSNQKDILIGKDKKRRIQLLRSRFKSTMDNWSKGYLDSGLKKV